MELDVMSAHQAAEYLGVHPETVKRLCRLGQLPASKFGRSWLITKGDLNDFADGYLGAPGRPKNSIKSGGI